jgi:PKD repeat protein
MHNSKKTLVTTLIVLMITAMIVPLVKADLTTDKDDYAPTDPVVLTGTGFIPNHQIDLTLTGPEGFTTQTWSVMSDENGDFQTIYTGGLMEGTFTLTATDGETTQTTTFTDAASINIKVGANQYLNSASPLDYGDVDQGDSLSITVTIQVPGLGGSSTTGWSLDYSTTGTQDNGDLSPETSGLPATGSNTGSSQTVSKTFSIDTTSLAAGPYIGHLTCSQTSGTSASPGEFYFEFTVVISTPENNPPTAAFTWSPTSPNEGGLVTFTDESTDTDGTVVAWSWNFGDSSATATSSLQNPTHTYADNGVYTVSLTVTDDDSATNTVTHDITVNNVAPVIGTVVGCPSAPIIKGSTISLSIPWTDVGVLDTQTAVVTWDDGTSDTTINAAAGGGSTISPVTHTYNAAGLYTISITLTDKDGGEDEWTCEGYIVVYDPSAGFVTGGGWIYSIAGSYVADPTAEGKATFGFVSQYKKGATVPTGNTEFQFQAGDLNFKSASYQWLVVTGGNQPKAIFKGEGTINGEGSYQFMLTAIDGGSKGADQFRIQIMDGNTVVYDNKINEDPTAYVGTTISGSIVIH